MGPGSLPGYFKMAKPPDVSFGRHRSYRARWWWGRCRAESSIQGRVTSHIELKTLAARRFSSCALGYHTELQELMRKKHLPTQAINLAIASGWLRTECFMGGAADDMTAAH